MGNQGQKCAERSQKTLEKGPWTGKGGRNGRLQALIERYIFKLLNLHVIFFSQKLMLTLKLILSDTLFSK